MKPLLPVLLLLAACAPPPGKPSVVPLVARLTDQELILGLSDGTRCRVDWRAAPEGRMDDCGPGFGYAVTVEERPNILRRLIEGLTLTLGAEGILRPMAEVVITDPAGIDRVFVSPPARGE